MRKLYSLYNENRHECPTEDKHNDEINNYKQKLYNSLLLHSFYSLAVQLNLSKKL